VLLWVSVAVVAWIAMSIYVAIVMARVISHADLEAEAAQLRMVYNLRNIGRPVDSA
jgi:hypothetical protein